MKTSEAKTVKAFCEAIWDACPWAAPAGYVPTPVRVAKFAEELFGKAFGTGKKDQPSED